MEHQPSDFTHLTEEQRVHCRQLIPEFAQLNAQERGPWMDTVVRDVWLMLNPDYNWTEEGEPDRQDELLTYGWTERVRGRFSCFASDGKASTRLPAVRQ